ncbi:MAG TPA: NUDIX hydrolase [Acidimicrobiales bacterium]|nr:NUDIX hydrolase [Acidimicrobiales bacterium]
MPGFRKLDETELLATNLITVATGRFEGPDGDTFERTLVHHPGAVGVVPLLDDGRVLLVRQYRAAADAELLEIPAGKRDVEGEAPEVTAARELVEEVGRRPGHLELLARFYTSVGYSDEHFLLYLGTDLRAAELDLQGVEEQHSSVHEVDLADVPAMIARGELVDAKTIIGLTMVLARGGG